MNRAWAGLIAVCLTTAAQAGSGPDHAALERLVLQDCGSCHGMTLKGGLGPDIRPDALRHYDHESLRAVIEFGVPGTPMPPWGPLLSDADLDWITAYLQGEREK